MLVRAAIVLLVLSVALPVIAEEDALDGWDRRFAKSIKTTTDAHVKLATWAEKYQLRRSAVRAWRRVLLFEPDHPGARAWFGYSRTESGAWTWPEARRQAVREMIDTNEKKAGEARRRFRAANRQIVDRLLAAGNTAEFRTRTDAGRIEKWNERMFTAFELLLRLSPGEQRPRELLGHPEFEGRRVDPKALRFLKARAARRAAGRAAAKAGFEVVPRGIDPAFHGAGLVAHAARTRNFTITTTWGQETATKLALAAERALAEVIRVNGLPLSVADRKRLRRIYIVKDNGQLRTFLMKFSEWDRDRIERQLSRFNNAWFKSGSVVCRIRGDELQIDNVMHYAVRKALRAYRKMGTDDLDDDEPAPALESWLLEALSTDVVMRLTGNSIASFSQVPDYSHEKRETTGKDRWMGLARQRVADDDDVPFDRLPRLRLIDVNAACSVKGYGMIQYLFERDAVRARAFVAMALVHGSEAAAKAVYKASLGDLDAGYREWVLLTW